MRRHGCGALLRCAASQRGSGPLWSGARAAARPFSEKLFVHRDTPDNPSDGTRPFSFTAPNAERARQIVARYPPQYKKAAMIPLLHLGQQQLGWTTLALMNHVAGLLEVPPMRVYEVATFYTMFNRDPVGKHLIQVCTTTPCELCGSEAVLRALRDEIGVAAIGETSPDGLFTLVEVECAGACVNAPVVAVNDDYYEDVTAAAAVGLIRAIRDGTKVPPPGPLGSGRSSCEPAGGRETSLFAENDEAILRPGFGLRADL